jgi:GT2 family glycosyltransferase
MTQPKLAVIIVSWNTKDLTRKCVTSVLRSQTDFEVEVLVVDNASSDGTPAMVAGEFPQVKLIANQENMGFGRGCNEGLKNTSAENVFFLNPDAEIEPNALQFMVDYLDAHPRVGVVGCALRYPDGSTQRAYYDFYSFFGSLKDNQLIKKRLKAASEEKTMPVDWVIGAVLMIRTGVLAQVGNFDEDFFLYGEEMELQYRIRKAGWEIIYLPEVAAVHHAGRSAGLARLNSTIHNYRGRYLFLKKHYPLYSVVLYLIKAIFALIFWTTYWGVQSIIQKSEQARNSRNLYWNVLRWHLNLPNLKNSSGPKIAIKNS